MTAKFYMISIGMQDRITCMVIDEHAVGLVVEYLQGKLGFYSQLV